MGSPLIGLSFIERYRREIKYLSPTVYHTLTDGDPVNVTNIAPGNEGSYDGIITGATVKQPGLVDYCMSFDGSDDKISFTSPAKAAGEPFTVGALFNTDIITGAAKVIVGARTGSGAGDLWKLASDVTSNGTFNLSFEYDPSGSGGVVTDAGAVSVGEWYLGVGVYDGSNIILYKNGVEVGTRVENKPNAAIDTVQGAIGMQADSSDEKWDGLIQHVFICETAITEAQILKLAQLAGLA